MRKILLGLLILISAKAMAAGSASVVRGGPARRVYLAVVTPTIPGSTYGGYNARVPLKAGTGAQQEMSISSDNLNIVAPANGVMTVWGYIRTSTIGTGCQGQAYLNNVAIPNTFYNAPFANTNPDGFVLPTAVVRVKKGDMVGVGVGGNPSNIISVSDQSYIHFKLDVD